MALEAYANTKWTTTRVTSTKNAPFAGLGAATPSDSGAFAGAGEGVALMLLGLGAIMVFNGFFGSRRGR